MARSAPIDPPATPLTDGVIALRLRRDSDLDAIAAASHDPDTRRWLDDEPMDTDARRNGSDPTAESWSSGISAPLVIADSATNAPVGIINLQFRDDAVATIAYSVFPSHRGQGIATRSVQLLARWAFRDLRMTELLLEVDAGNAASIRVAEKSGFRLFQTRTETDRTLRIFRRRAPAVTPSPKGSA